MVRDLEALTLATGRGGLRIDLSEAPQAVAYETLSRRPDRWLHGVAFCLPAAQARGACRCVLTELGPDRSALRIPHREEVLFDLGLGRTNVDFCIRSGDPDLLTDLRQAQGRSVLEPGNPVMGRIVAASPHRVACSRLGRIEVTQAIGRTETPEGPHTHVLPEFLAENATHDPATPIPEGLVPCLTLHPANPCFDALGRDKPFDPSALDAFQTLLDLWGRPDYRTEKARVQAALAAGTVASDYVPPDDELAMTALRVALRQIARTQPHNRSLDPWRRRFDAV